MRKRNLATARPSGAASQPRLVSASDGIGFRQFVEPCAISGRIASMLAGYQRRAGARA
jgi:hypothetical protein